MAAYLLRILGSLAAMFVAGFMNQANDIAGNVVWYRESIFPQPGESAGAFWGTQGETWANKWAINEAGAPLVGTERFLFSSTLLVWLTDLWHFSKSCQILAFQAAVLLYRRPDKKILYLADLVALKIAFSAGWYAGNVLLR
jgi:hypothetical protein